jgi:hypothetical protein
VGTGPSGQRNRSRSAVRGRASPCPWPFTTAPESQVHGRVADGGGPGSRLKRVCAGQGCVARFRRAVCKTVGSAYVGSNPTPATTCENGPLARNSRLCGPFLLCPVVCHLVALRAAVSRCPRTHSGRDSCPITVGAHRRLFHGRPRTGRAGGMFRLDVPPVSRACIPRVPVRRPGDSAVRRAGKGGCADWSGRRFGRA